MSAVPDLSVLKPMTMLIALVVGTGCLLFSVEADAFRPSKHHRARSYGELYVGLGGSAALNPRLVPSAGALATLGLGFNPSSDLGLTLGAAGAARRTLDGDSSATAMGHIDVEFMPIRAQVEPYALFGVAFVHGAETSPPAELQRESALGLRVGAGVDVWMVPGSDRGTFLVPILGVRAAYTPSVVLGPWPVRFNQELMIDFQLKFHVNIDFSGSGSNPLNPVGF